MLRIIKAGGWCTGVSVMRTMQDRDAMLIKNFEAFKKLLPSLLSTDRDRIALIRDEKLVRIFDTVDELFAYTKANYSDNYFSAQTITDKKLRLGIFSATFGLDAAS